MTATLARLEIRSSSGASQELLLDRDLTVIGRAPDNALVLNEPAVSRYHARIAREADRYLITDLGSSNGTRLNDTLYARDAALPPPRAGHACIDDDARARMKPGTIGGVRWVTVAPEVPASELLVVQGGLHNALRARAAVGHTGSLELDAHGVLRAAGRL